MYSRGSYRFYFFNLILAFLLLGFLCEPAVAQNFPLTIDFILQYLYNRISYRERASNEYEKKFGEG